VNGGKFNDPNGGVLGSLISTPHPNPPQVGILGPSQDPESSIGVNGGGGVWVFGGGGGAQGAAPTDDVRRLELRPRIVDGREAVQSWQDKAFSDGTRAAAPQGRAGI